MLKVFGSLTICQIML